MKKTIIFVIIVALIGVGFYLLTNNSNEDEKVLVLADYTETKTVETNEVLAESLVISTGESTVLESGAELTVQKDLTIDGALGCRDGSLTVTTEGKLTINDTVVCQNEGEGDVTIIAKGGLVMGKDARIVADGNVQMVDGESVVRSEAELSALYDEVEQIPATGFSVGPFVGDETVLPETNAEVSFGAEGSPLLSRFFNVAHAQVDNGTTTVNLTGQPIRVSGKIKVETPRKGAKRIVVFDFPNTPEVTVQDFELEGPAGRAGEADTGSCDVNGKDGEDAFRFNAQAPNLIVNNFTLTLGDGGEGGEATTGDGCKDAKAKGGKGGNPGNFRMIGSEKFEIKGAFNIHPGRGGAGGGATAKGKVGDPGEKGGDANATGGKGSDNKKKLSVSGTVAGTSNVQFGDAVGGFGGFASAEGGAGGDADKCGMKGGDGGKATAKSGTGGDAKLTVSGGAGRMDFANDIGGQGGMVDAIGGIGGAGGSCGEDKKGGDGGVGGDASATEGKGGMGKTGRANGGAMLGNDGGDGGKGGDGCTEGIGGVGGHGGLEDGEKGEDGKNLCITVTKEEDYISLLPGEIEVIQYMDYYIPITNLVRFTGEECDGEEHWHPGPNGAINTMGYVTPDPDPNGCGFGKTSEVKVQIIQDPNYVEEDTSGGREEGSGGRMIQIDPPTLVIPAH